MIIKVKAHPKSKKNLLKKLDQKNLEVWLNEPPVNNKANAKITEMLASYFNVAKSLVVLKSGQTTKLKTFEIFGVEEMPKEHDLFNSKKVK